MQIVLWLACGKSLVVQLTPKPSITGKLVCPFELGEGRIRDYILVYLVMVVVGNYYWEK